MAHCKANQLDCNGFCNRFDSPCIKKNCRFFGVNTNADRIRAMSDEELAAFFAEHDMILLRKALSVFEAESLIPENAQDELLKDMLVTLQQPAEEG